MEQLDRKTYTTDGPTGPQTHGKTHKTTHDAPKNSTHLPVYKWGHVVKPFKIDVCAAARLIFRMRRSEHITSALISLHWLCVPVPERISFTALHLQCSYLDVFHPYRRHDIKTTAAVFCLSPSRSRPTARSTLYSRQTGVLSCRRQHVERPSVAQPHHICTVTRGLQTTSQGFPLLSFLPRHSHLTYLSLFIIIVVFLFF